MSSEFIEKVVNLRIEKFKNIPIAETAGLANQWIDPINPSNYDKYPIAAEFRKHLRLSGLNINEIEILLDSTKSFLTTVQDLFFEFNKPASLDVETLTIQGAHKLLIKTNKYSKYIKARMPDEQFLIVKTIFRIRNEDSLYPKYIAPSKN